MFMSDHHSLCTIRCPSLLLDSKEIGTARKSRWYAEIDSSKLVVSRVPLLHSAEVQSHCSPFALCGWARTHDDYKAWPFKVIFNIMNYALRKKEKEVI